MDGKLRWHNEFKMGNFSQTTRNKETDKKTKQNKATPHKQWIPNHLLPKVFFYRQTSANILLYCCWRLEWFCKWIENWVRQKKTYFVVGFKEWKKNQQQQKLIPVLQDCKKWQVYGGVLEDFQGIAAVVLFSATCVNIFLTLPLYVTIVI